MFIKKLTLRYSKQFLQDIPKGLEYIHLKNNALILGVNPLNLLSVCLFFKKQTQLQYKTLIDIIAVDYPLKERRFTVIYNFLSTLYNERIFLKCTLPGLSSINSISSLFLAAGWFEREVWDMFGIFFVNNPDLRRILTDYGFQGHPFRKDFPLTGYLELRYDENQKRIVSEQLEISQEFRVFDFLEV